MEAIDLSLRLSGRISRVPSPPIPTHSALVLPRRPATPPPGERSIGIFAKCDIAQGEELTYHYMVGLSHIIARLYFYAPLHVTACHCMVRRRRPHSFKGGCF